MTSQVLRLAVELGYFWRGYAVPHVSLDIPWCWEGYNRAEFRHAETGAADLSSRAEGNVKGSVR